MAIDDLILMGRNTIRKEAQALASLVDTLDESFARASQLLFGCQGTVLLSGMGKSGLVARKWAATFSGTGTKAYFLNPAEASHGDLGLIRPGDVLVVLSFSGETEELAYVLRHARDCGVPSIAVTGNRESSLARGATVTLSVHLSEEACPLGLAPTTSTTLMMALGDALAVTLMQMRGFTEADFARLHPGGSIGRRLWLRVGELMHVGDKIPLVPARADFKTVLMEMTRKCLGLAVVTEGGDGPGAIVGVITDGDLRRYLQRNEIGEPTTARDLMTGNPKTVRAQTLAVEARELMERHSIHHLLVLDDSDRLVGVLHQDDLMRAKMG
jgi:arabinose-5-phosphate isomerase